MSVRLSGSNGNGGFEPNDDLLEIDWDTSAFDWPLAATGIPAAPVTTVLHGGFTMESIFAGADTSGYGIPGAAETIFGGGITMTADPFGISEFSTPCPATPQLSAAPVAVSSAEPRYGFTNLFTQELRGTLSLRMSFAANVAASCDASPQPTQSVDNSGAPPMPVRFEGKFAISPSITSDGKLRFGKITINDSVITQPSTFAFVRTCTQTSICDAKAFPARLKFKKLTAEVLLGDVFP